MDILALDYYNILVNILMLGCSASDVGMVYSLI